MEISLQVNGVDTITAKEGGKKYAIAWGFEAAPATLRQVVKVFIPAGRESDFTPGKVVKLRVSEVDVRNGALGLRLAQ